MNLDDANAKNETLATRGNQETSRYSPNLDCCRGLRLSSSAVGNQPVRAGRANWEGPGAYRTQSRRILGGGIVEQLIEEARDQLAQLEAQREKLAQRLEELEALREQLTQKE